VDPTNWRKGKASESVAGVLSCLSGGGKGRASCWKDWAKTNKNVRGRRRNTGKCQGRVFVEAAGGREGSDRGVDGVMRGRVDSTGA